MHCLGHWCCCDDSRKSQFCGHAQVYEQVGASRLRLSKQIAEKNRTITDLEQRLAAKDEELRSGTII